MQAGFNNEVKLFGQCNAQPYICVTIPMCRKCGRMSSVKQVRNAIIKETKAIVKKLSSKSYSQICVNFLLQSVLFIKKRESIFIVIGTNNDRKP